jgi:hypothetical protein
MGATYSAALVVVVLARLAVVASSHDVDVGRRAIDSRRGHGEGGHGGDSQDDGGQLHDVEVRVGGVLFGVCLSRGLGS